MAKLTQRMLSTYRRLRASIQNNFTNNVEATEAYAVTSRDITPFLTQITQIQFICIVDLPLLN